MIGPRGHFQSRAHQDKVQKANKPSTATSITALLRAAPAQAAASSAAAPAPAEPPASVAPELAPAKPACQGIGWEICDDLDEAARWRKLYQHYAFYIEGGERASKKVWSAYTVYMTRRMRHQGTAIAAHRLHIDTPLPHIQPIYQQVMLLLLMLQWLFIRCCCCCCSCLLLMLQFVLLLVVLLR